MLQFFSHLTVPEPPVRLTSLAKSFPFTSFHDSCETAKVFQLLHNLVKREESSVFPEPPGSDTLLNKSQGAFPSPSICSRFCSSTVISD